MGESTENLPTKAARGAVLTFSGQIARTLTQLLGVVVLARLLTPADFGLVAMVLAVAGVGEIVREFGLGLAVIQAKGLTIGQRNNLFWANTLLGCLIGVAFYALAWPLAAFYGDDRLVSVTQCIAITFVFNGMAAQYRAGLQRELKYIGVVVADVASMVCGVVTAVVLSLLGFGYWSIVAQQIVHTICSLAVVAIASGWLPGRIRRRQGTRPFISAGWNIFIYHMLVYVSRNVDTVLIGAKFGATAVGYYNRAFSLMTSPLGQFLTPSTRLAVSVLARLHDDLSKFSRYLQRAQDSLNFVCLSMLALLFGLASPVVAVLLGPNWDSVVPLFQILAIAGVFQVLSYPPVWALLSLGYSRTNLVQTVVARSALIGAVVVGSLFSVQGVAIGYACGMAIVWPISILALGRVSPLSVFRLVWSACRQVVVFGVGAVIVSVSAMHLHDISAILVICIGIVVMAAYLGIVSVLWPHFRRDALDVYRAFLYVRAARIG